MTIALFLLLLIACPLLGYLLASLFYRFALCYIFRPCPTSKHKPKDR